MGEGKTKKTYGLSEEIKTGRMRLPVLEHRPRDPKRYHPGIGLIGCGGITEQHLRAYRNAGYNVVALCDLHLDRARRRKAEFYPDAEVYRDYRRLLAREDIEVVDIATHPPERVELIRAALEAGKHVLSQKPFVLDLAVGEALVSLADRNRLRLAVNQNGRWSPHWSWMRKAVQADLIGDLAGAQFEVCWDHNWTAGTVFDRIPHLILYDFAIHWFDIATVFLGARTPRRVYASVEHSKSQRARPPLLAHAVADYEEGQATFSFSADCRFGQRDTTTLVGAKGCLRSEGPSLLEQRVTLFTDKGYGSPTLRGAWFPDGFHGSMGELLCAIEENREPENSARGNLRSLALCFAAVASADTGKPMVPGKVKRISV